MSGRHGTAPIVEEIAEVVMDRVCLALERGTKTDRLRRDIEIIVTRILRAHGDSHRLWKAIADITDSDAEGRSVTIFGPNPDFGGDDYRIDVDCLEMDEPQSLFGNDRLELLEQAKQVVTDAMFGQE